MEVGLAQIQLGMDIYQGLNSPPVFWPLLRSLQAEVCILAGKPEQGLAFIEEVLAIQSSGYEGMLTVEFYRLKGDILLALTPDNPKEADFWYQRALELAKEQRATMWELRCAISLVRMWQNQESRQKLSEAYAKFTEGFNTPDLLEARDLLKTDNRVT